MKPSGSSSVPAKVVLDTSAYSHFRAGNTTVLEWIAGAVCIYLPITVLGELHAGFLLGRRSAENRNALKEFLREPFVEVLNTTTEVSEKYAEVFVALRRAGTPIPINDVWIAAATLVSNAELLTFDSDFERVEGLRSTVLRSPKR